MCVPIFLKAASPGKGHVNFVCSGYPALQNRLPQNIVVQTTTLFCSWVWGSEIWEKLGWGLACYPLRPPLGRAGLLEPHTCPISLLPCPPVHGISSSSVVCPCGLGLPLHGCLREDAVFAQWLAFKRQEVEAVRPFNTFVQNCHNLYYIQPLIAVTEPAQMIQGRGERDFTFLFFWLTRHCDDHFAIYTNIELLCCIPEANIMWYINYIYLNKKRSWENFWMERKWIYKYPTLAKQNGSRFHVLMHQWVASNSAKGAQNGKRCCALLCKLQSSTRDSESGECVLQHPTYWKYLK